MAEPLDHQCSRSHVWLEGVETALQDLSKAMQVQSWILVNILQGIVQGHHPCACNCEEVDCCLQNTPISMQPVPADSWMGVRKQHAAHQVNEGLLMTLMDKVQPKQA